MKYSIKKLCEGNDELIYCVLFSFIDTDKKFLFSNFKGFSDFIGGDILEDLRYIYNFVINNGGNFILQKSKRTRSKIGKNGKRIKITTQDYSNSYISDVISNPGIDLISLDVHDFNVENFEVLSTNIMDKVEDNIDKFIKGEIEINGIDFDTARKLLYRRIFSTIEMSSIENHYESGNNIYIGKDVFGKEIVFPYLHMSIIFYNLGYLEFESLFINIEHYGCMKKNMLYGCEMKVTEKLGKIVKQHMTIDNYVLDLFINEKYKQLQIEGNKKRFNLRPVLEYDASDINIDKIEKKHPYSETKLKTHRSKTTKYIVSENIMIDRD